MGPGLRVMNKAQARLASDGFGGSETWPSPRCCDIFFGMIRYTEEQKIL